MKSTKYRYRVSCIYDKRYIQDDSINTLAFFHKKLRLSGHKQK